MLDIVLVWLPLGVSSLALMSSGLGHTAFVGVIVICLCLAGACSAFCRLGCHGLPIATGRFAGAAHVDRAQRVCLSCNAGALGDERHLIFECTALASLLSRYADLFKSSTDTIRSIFAQPDRMGVFHYVIDYLNFMKI